MNLAQSSLGASSASSNIESANTLCNCLLFLLSFATTLYINIAETGGISIRPVQVFPVLVWFVVIFLMKFPAIRGMQTYYYIPGIFVTYLGVRFLQSGPDGWLFFSRSIVNYMAYISALHIMQRSRSYEMVTYGLVAGCFFSCVLALFNINFIGVEPQMGSGRWQGLMPGANRFANLCALSILLLFGGLYNNSGKKNTMLKIIVIAVSAMGVLMSGSRSAIVLTATSCFLIMVLVAFAERRSVINIRMCMFGVVCFVALGAFYTFYYDKIPQRIIDAIENPESAVAIVEDDSRRELFTISYEYFLENPVFGYGTEAEHFSLVMDSGDIHESSAHNTYLHLLSVSGLVGFSLYMLLVLHVGYNLLLIIVLARQYPLHYSGQCVSESTTAFGLIFYLISHEMTISLAQTMHVWMIYAVCSYTCMKNRNLSRSHAL